jgi:hypothetical protein
MTRKTRSSDVIVGRGHGFLGASSLAQFAGISLKFKLASLLHGVVIVQ